ncbi:MAG: hypothetical protein ACXWLB_15225 [Reyranella sp.]
MRWAEDLCANWLAGELTYFSQSSARDISGPVWEFVSHFDTIGASWCRGCRLTALSNVVAYGSRRSRTEDRHHDHSYRARIGSRDFSIELVGAARLGTLV